MLTKKFFLYKIFGKRLHFFEISGRSEWKSEVGVGLNWNFRNSFKRKTGSVYVFRLNKPEIRNALRMDIRFELLRTLESAAFFKKRKSNFIGK